jgi:hypothetical protein
MSAPRKADPNDRLEANLSTLLKRYAAHWQLYAAVTGSAMAMATNVPVSSVGAGIRDFTEGQMSSLLAANQSSVISENTPLTRAMRSAMATRNSGLLLGGEAPAIVKASQSQTPAIGRIVPLYGTVGIIQPGEWVSIYGTNLASGKAVWNGDFPTSLGGTRVEINGRSAFLSLVSPGQINLQAPDDTAAGPVSVVVLTNTGTARGTVT